MTVEERRYRVPRREAARGWLRDLLAEAPGLPAQVLALLGLLGLAVADGGYYATDWYPIGLLVLALTAVWAVAVPPRIHGRRAPFAAVVLLVLFGAWALASIGWADERGAAWDGANRALFYAALFGLFALWGTPARQARWLVAIVGLGIALIGLVELLRFAAAGDPTGFLLADRFAEPVGYQNGNAALWFMGALACLWLAAAPEAPPVLRGLALGATPMLASLAVMGQSRGSLFALPGALLVLFVVAPSRLRLLAAAILAGLAVALAAGPAVDVVDGADSSALPGLVDDAARTILIASLVVTVLGALGALADRAWTPAPATSTSRRLTKLAYGVVACVALVVAVVAVSRAGELSSELSQRWSEFKSNEAAESGSARLGSGSTNRYDFWTVAWDNFEREPVLGVGIDNFQQDYLVRGESREKPRFPHSLELALLSETGLVGTLMFVSALAAALVAALRTRRRLTRPAAGAVASALGLFAYWLLHASVDWLYELPALGALAFAMLGLACAVREEPERGMGRAPLVWRVAPAVLCVAAAVSFALPWLAEREVMRASETWRTAPAAAYERLDRAAGLNPVSVRPQLFEGTIAINRDEPARAERAFLEAVESEPRNGYAWLQLAALASARQDRPVARRRIRRAIALSPGDEATRMARNVIADGRRITPKQVLSATLKYARGGTE